jgi:multiple sugar transport system substrate-binding protein
MFKTKRLWFLLVLVLTLIISCSGFTAPKVVKISFWHGETQPVRVQAMQALIDKFQKENPNIQVTQATCPNQDMFPKMIAALSTNTNPDMGSCVPDRAMAYQKLGYGQNVDSLVQKIDQKYKYIGKPKSNYYFNNHYWSVPLWSITVMLFYREDLLKKAGFNGPPKTWNELLDMSKALTGDGKYGIGLPASSGQNCTDQVVWSFMSTNKAQVYDEQGKIVFNNPKTVETYKYLTELSKYSPADATGWSWAETKLAFTSGKAAMGFVFGSVLLDLVQQADFADSVKAVSIPIPEGGQPGGLTSTEGMMIFTKDKAKRQACEKFLEFFFRDDNYGLTLANMQPGLYLPITETGMKSEAYFQNPVIKRFNKVIDAEFAQVKTGSLFGFEYPKRNQFVGEIGTSYILGETLQRAVSKQLTPEKAVEWGFNKMMSFK